MIIKAGRRLSGNYVIVSIFKFKSVKAKEFPEKPFNAISNNCIANLATDCQSYAGTTKAIRSNYNQE